MVPLSLISQPGGLRKVEVDRFADGQDHESQSKRWTSSVEHRLAAAGGSYSPSRVFTISMAFTLPLASPMMRCGAARKTNLRAFFFGGRGFFFDRRHVFAFAPVNDGDFGSPCAARCARNRWRHCRRR